jgi:1,4-alpha-glucan branching enzyme
MAKLGAFTFLLHGHLPYCRQSGPWPHGEHWLHEAAAETYVPLLNALTDLYEQGIPARLTLSLTPILCEQLADPLVQANFVAYLDEKIAGAEDDVRRLYAEGQSQRARLAMWYYDWYSSIKESYHHRFGGNILGALRRLQDLGMLEIISSAATHATLPLLATEQSARAQLRVALACHRRHFGRAARAIWLPAGAYRPGIEAALAHDEVRLVITTAPTLAAGALMGRAKGDALGSGGSFKRNYVSPLSPSRAATPVLLHLPYYTGAKGQCVHSGVSVIGTNDALAAQVWNGSASYPSDGDYREFNRQDSTSGLHYWRVTDPASRLDDKAEWQPERAMQRVGQHASHFASQVIGLTHASAAHAGRRYGLLCAAFNAELFGHGWFEGIAWLREVLQLLSDSAPLELTTASDYVEHHPPLDALALPTEPRTVSPLADSLNHPDTAALWQAVHQAEQRMARIARQHAEHASMAAEPVLAQLARETLLLQSSDWYTLILSGQARDYAHERFAAHLGRFNALAEGVERGHYDEDVAAECYLQDKVFPDVDWRWWA